MKTFFVGQRSSSKRQKITAEGYLITVVANGAQLEFKNGNDIVATFVDFTFVAGSETIVGEGEGIVNEQTPTLQAAV